jgi:hypothetical protein
MIFNYPVKDIEPTNILRISFFSLTLIDTPEALVSLHKKLKFILFEEKLLY